MEPVETANPELESRTATLISHTPGRIRVRLHPAHRDRPAIQRIHTHLARHPSIDEVETNAGTGSVLVKYEPGKLTHDDFWDILDDVGVVAAAAAGEGGDISESRHSSTASAMLAAVDDLDRRISRMTGRRIDLRLLVPLTLGIVGLRLAMLQGGLGFSAIPPFLVLWFAFDSFLQLHARHPANPDQETAPAT